MKEIIKKGTRVVDLEGKEGKIARVVLNNKGRGGQWVIWYDIDWKVGGCSMRSHDEIKVIVEQTTLF